MIPAHVVPSHKRMVVPFQEGLANLAEKGVAFNWNGAPHLALPHDPEHVRLCRNFGISATAPILHYYDWAGTTPFEAQKATAALLTTEESVFVLNGMGTGKTRAALLAFDYLRREGLAKRMLVVAPLSTLTMTWMREAFAILPHLKVNVLYGTSAKRHQMLRDPADIYVVNHDGMAIIANEIMGRADIDVVTIDELAVYRSHTSQRFKTMKAVLANKPRRWGLTGSPTPNAPTDAWAQVKLIAPWRAPMRFNDFRESTMTKLTMFKWAPRPSSLDTVHKMMQPSVRFTLDDVVELPDLIVREVEIEQGPKQAAVYTELRKNLRSLFAKGEVNAVNAGVLVNKLLQVSMGWVYTDERGVVALDNEKRLAALVDAIESTDNKVIVFVPYMHALDGVVNHLRNNAKIPCESVSGQTSKKERDRIFGAFQFGLDPRVIVAHPECMAHGLTLTAADTIIWFGPYASLEIFEQANARISRPGQKHKQQILMFSGTTVEAQTYRRLREKQQVQGALLDLFQSVIN